jgi:predicted enzyme related to lactoylglutathione lyase
MAGQTRFNHIGPQFAVQDVSRAMSFYRNVLGFELDYIDGDPVRYAVVFRDEVYIHLSLSNAPGFDPGGGRAFVAVSGVEPVWARACSEAPASVCEPLENRDYGHGARFRGFAVKDPDGNVLRIAEPQKE